jgi:hypothetical protein
MNNINQETKVTFKNLCDTFKTHSFKTGEVVESLIMYLDEINSIVDNDDITHREDVLTENEIENLSLSEKILKVKILEIKEVLQNCESQLNSYEGNIISDVKKQVCKEVREELKNKKKKK